MYFGASVNESPVIALPANAAIEGGAMLAVTLSETGLAIAKKGEAAIGILIAETDDIGVGETATIQVKDIGLWKAGAAINAGALLASDANGKAVTAEDGDFILAQALEAATEDGHIIKVQIIKAGKSGSGGAGPDMSQYQKKITVTGILKCDDGDGTITAATEGTDYSKVKKLADLEDVEGTDAPGDGKVLKYQTDKWKPGDDQTSEAV